MRRFPASHLFLVALLTVGMCSLVVAQFGSSAADRFKADNVVTVAPVAATLAAAAPPARAAAVGTMLVELPLPPATPVPDPDDTPAAAQLPGLIKRSEKVRPGDNLSLIFKRQALTPGDVHRVLQSGPLAKRLTRIYPGHRLDFSLDNHGELVKLTYSPGPLEALEFTRNGDRFEAREVVHEPQRVPAYKFAEIDHSLFVASQRAGLTDELTMRLAHIFQWDVDFVLDIRAGDSFHILFEEQYLNGDFIGNGEILAAEFVNRGTSHRAFRYRLANGETDYYTPEGESMRKAFLRAPVEFTRISSNFNLRRVHPMFKRQMPHRGIDYAAPSGTPVIAAGDGTVRTASRSEANGNFLVLQHGEQFQTKYLHLSKFARGVRAGKKVKQGQVIGYVGATGWATAAHLHYEFLVNGIHKNPRTVALPKAEPIPEQERSRFSEEVRSLAAMLDSYKQEELQYAAAQ